MFNGKEFGQNIVDTVKVYVSGALAPLAENMKAEADARRAENEKLRTELEELRAAIKAVPVPEPVDLSGLEAEAADQRKWLETSMAELAAELRAIPAPIDGKVADPELVRSMVAEAVAELPPAKDGTSVTAEDIAPLVDGSVHERMAALVPDIADLVAKAVAEIPKPQDGKSVDIEEFKALVAEEVAESVKEAVSAIPSPMPPSSEELLSLIAPEVEKAISALPVPKDGASVTTEDVAPMIAAEVEKAVAAIPTPRDGRDGLDVRDMFRADGGKLIAVMSDGTTRDLGVYVGKDGRDGIDGERGSDGLPGAPGSDGQDGVGFDDLDVVLGDDGVDLVFTQGDRTKTFPLPVPHYRGVHSAEESYRKGSVVTWAGSSWIAKMDNPTGKPDTENSGWSLSTKRGRDAKTPARIGA